MISVSFDDGKEHASPVLRAVDVAAPPRGSAAGQLTARAAAARDCALKIAGLVEQEERMIARAAEVSVVRTLVGP